MSKESVSFASRKVVAFICWLIIGSMVGGVCGCSSLQPATKSQSMTVTALGFPAITVVTTTTQSAENDGDDEGANTQSTTADVRPDVETSVMPK